MHSSRFLPPAIATMLLAMVTAPWPASVKATGTASITIHARLCPVGGPTTDIFAECHGTPVPADWGVTFRVHHRPAKAPNARGNLIFRHFAAGDHILVQASGPGSDAVLVRLWCGVPGSGVPARSLRSRTVHLNSGDRMVCDWYFIPVDGA